MVKPRIADPAYSMAFPAPPAAPMCAMMARMMSFRAQPEWQYAVYRHPQGFGAGLPKCLRGEDMRCFRGTDADGDAAEGAVGGRVRIRPPR